jgi:8-oxo-dGTP pyrophosphatase MutT (NUDIX family)
MKTYCVATAVIQDGDKYFIAKRASSKKIAPGLWEFVTGFVEDHEAAEDTILRELMEEVAAKGVIIRELGILQIDKDQERWIVIPFLVQVMNGVRIDPEEHSTGKWVTWEELEAMPSSALRYDPKQLRQILALPNA